ncbi:MAG: hypothetical protein NTZ14_19050 [Hyphomicrobiales bacterium]|nr:hypothetical protein [Hyphomicrobiales bacterium]
MYGWFLWCALSGLILGFRSPMQVLIAAAAIALPTGFVYQIWSGFDVAMITAIGGAMVLQISFLTSTLVLAMVSPRPLAQGAPARVRPEQ